MELVTKQKYHEHLCLLICKDAKGETWYYALVPNNKMPLIRDFKQGKKVCLNDCYRYIEYRDEHGVLQRATGPGKVPPNNIVKWINANYGPVAIDENTTLDYTADDIRLCTMQVSSADRSTGIQIAYHKHERFLYIKPDDNFQNTLATRAGVQPYDRLIEINGTNIEGIVDSRMIRLLMNRIGYTIQLLFCNPATYEHYKTNKKRLHSNLETVKLMKPVRNSQRNADLNEYERVDENDEYCAIRWRGTADIRVVSASSLGKPLSTIRLYEVVTINNVGKNREARVIFKGSKADCEILLSETDVDRSDQQDSNGETTEATLKPEERQESGRRDRMVMQLIGMLMNAMFDENEDAHRVACNGCHNLRILSDRYKCLQCENYNLCGSCFEKRRETRDHRSGHTFAHFKIPMELFGEPITKANEEVTLTKFRERFARVEHTDVTCKGCQIKPIIGIRFKCDTCHDYDLCFDCMEKQVVTDEHDTKHPLVVVGKDRFNQIDVDDIELGEELGKGAFGAVHKARWKSKNRQVACKVINVPAKDQRLEQSFLRELDAYTEISGAYILKLFGFTIQVDLDNGARKFLLIMEFMSRGSLMHLIKQDKKISLRRKLDMACHIASGMRKLHARHMIHRDIRPDNILVNENYIAKIGDMGIARVMEANNRLTVIGYVPYMPPEFFLGFGKYDQSLDVFTFGLTLNYLFTEKEHETIRRVIPKVKLTEESPIFRELIARCIHDHPSQRPSAIELEATLQTYKRGFDQIVLSENPKYIQLPTEAKNEVFLKFYEIFHPKVKSALERQFPPPPPIESTAEENNDMDILQILAQFLNRAAEKNP